MGFFEIVGGNRQKTGTVVDPDQDPAVVLKRKAQNAIRELNRQLIDHENKVARREAQRLQRVRQAKAARHDPGAMVVHLDGGPHTNSSTR
jgi:hypothetical protein